MHGMAPTNPNVSNDEVEKHSYNPKGTFSLPRHPIRRVTASRTCVCIHKSQLVNDLIYALSHTTLLRLDLHCSHCTDAGTEAKQFVQGP